MTQITGARTGTGQPKGKPRVVARTGLPILMSLMALVLIGTGPSRSAPDPARPESWEILPERFESTGGGGWMIENYRPVVEGDRCVTDFVAVSPDGRERFLNSVSFTATRQAGGVLCTDGQWRARDGSASGTTPLRIYIRDGIARRAP